MYSNLGMEILLFLQTNQATILFVGQTNPDISETHVLQDALQELGSSTTRQSQVGIFALKFLPGSAEKWQDCGQGH